MARLKIRRWIFVAGYSALLAITVLIPGLKPLQGGGPAVDPDPRIKFAYDQNMNFGIAVLKDASGKPLNNQLTYALDGSTNDTIVQIDNQAMQIGSKAGKWLEKDVKVGAASRSTWAVGNVHIIQILEIVPSKQPVQVTPGVQKRLLDTCMVRYEIENKDNKPHNVGLRLQLDTKIGNNDGVPFAVPGLTELISTHRDFKTPQEVPDFVRALEKGNLKDPGIVAHMSLKVGGGLEAPGRVSLTHWPSDHTKWEVPLQDFKPPTGGNADSCAVLYWNPTNLGAGASRKLGFAYGLGYVDSSAQGSLGLTVDGTFVVGKTINVLAQINSPKSGQTVTLKLPPAMTRVEGKETEPVPVPKGKNVDTSVVTWKVKANQAGDHKITLQSSTGQALDKIVSFAAPDITSPQYLLVPTKETPTMQSAVDKAAGLKDPPRLTVIIVHSDHRDPGFLAAGKQNIIIATAAAFNVYYWTILPPGTVAKPPSPNGYPIILGLAAFSDCKNVTMTSINTFGGLSISGSELVHIEGGGSYDPPAIAQGGISVSKSCPVFLERLAFPQKGSPGIAVTDSFIDPAGQLTRWRNLNPLEVPHYGQVLGSLPQVGAFGKPCVTINQCGFSLVGGAAVAAAKSHVGIYNSTFADISGPGVVFADGSFGAVDFCSIKGAVADGILFSESEGLVANSSVRFVVPGLFTGHGIEISPKPQGKGKRPQYTVIGPNYPGGGGVQVSDCTDVGVLMNEGGTGCLNATVKNCDYGIAATKFSGRIEGEGSANNGAGLVLFDCPDPVIIGQNLFPFACNGNRGGLSMVIEAVKKTTLGATVGSAARYTSWPSDTTTPGVLLYGSNVTLNLGGDLAVQPPWERVYASQALRINTPDIGGGLIIASGSKVEGGATVEYGEGPGIIVTGSTLIGGFTCNKNWDVGMSLAGSDVTLNDPALQLNAGGGLDVFGGTLKIDRGQISGNSGGSTLRDKVFAPEDFMPFGVKLAGGAKLTMRGTTLDNFSRAGLWITDGSDADAGGLSVSSWNYADWTGHGVENPPRKCHDKSHDGLLIEGAGKLNFHDGSFNVTGGKGTRVLGGGKVILRNNRPWGTVMGDHYLHVQDGGDAWLDNCYTECWFSNSSSIQVSAGGVAKITGNDINNELYGDGVYVANGAKAEVDRNFFNVLERDLSPKRKFVAFRIEKGADVTYKDNTAASTRVPVKPVIIDPPPAPEEAQGLGSVVRGPWSVATGQRPRTTDHGQRTTVRADTAVQKKDDKQPAAWEKARADLLKTLKARKPTAAPAIRQPPVAKRGPTTGSAGPSPKGVTPSDALTRIGQTQVRQGQTESAVSLLQEAVRTSPNNAAGREALANALLDHKQAAEAEAQFKEAVRLEPNNARFVGNYGEAQLVQKKWKEAAVTLASAVALDPRQGQYQADLAQALLGLNRIPEADAAAATAVQLGLKEHPVYALLSTQLLKAGNVHANTGRWADAEKTYREAIAVNPADNIAFATLGSLLARRGNSAEAVESWQHAVQLDPQNAAYQAQLGDAQWTVKAWSKAEAAYRDAVALRPKFGAYHDRLSQALVRQGKTSEALLSLRNGVAAEPGNAHLQGALAILLLNQARAPEALTAAKEAVRLGLAPSQLPVALRDLIAKGTSQPGIFKTALDFRLLWFSERTGGRSLVLLKSNGTVAKSFGGANTGDRTPAWSSNGNQIVYGSGADGKLHVMDADGKNARPLTNGADTDDLPAWSPDGKRIAFCRTPPKGQSQIFVMNADGTNLINVTNHASVNRDPAWSPDGKKIAFTSLRATGKGYRLFVMDADGKNVRMLTNTDTTGWVYPAWSPDGKRIAYTDVSHSNLELFLFDLEKNTTAPLTQLGKGVACAPAWSPDGSQIAFEQVIQQQKERILWIMDADGTRLTRVTAEKGVTPDRPAWEPWAAVETILLAAPATPVQGKK